MQLRLVILSMLVIVALSFAACSNAAGTSGKATRLVTWTLTPCPTAVDLTIPDIDILETPGAVDTITAELTLTPFVFTDNDLATAVAEATVSAATCAPCCPTPTP